MNGLGLLSIALAIGAAQTISGQSRTVPGAAPMPSSRTDTTGQSQSPTTTTTTTTQVVRTTSWSMSTYTTDMGVTFSEKSNEKKLAESGPVFAPVFNMSEFDIIAFAKGQWPAVLDYQLAPGSVGFLMVFSDGVDPFYFRLGGNGRQLQTLTLPARFGQKPKISRYSIRVWVDQAGATVPAQFAVYGIGAGPRAVGSITIDQLKFGPAEFRPWEKKQAEYSFRAKRPFDRVEAEFVRVGLAKQGGPIYAQLVDSKEHKNVKQEVQTRATWDGKPGKAFKPLSKQDKADGQYKLAVRAWLKSEKDGDWLAAWSDDIVLIPSRQQ